MEKALQLVNFSLVEKRDLTPNQLTSDLLLVGKSLEMEKATWSCIC